MFFSWPRSLTRALLQSNYLATPRMVLRMASSGPTNGQEASKLDQGQVGSVDGGREAPSSQTHLSSIASPQGAGTGGQQDLQETAVSQAATHTLSSLEDLFGPAQPVQQEPPGAEDALFDMDTLAPFSQSLARRDRKEASTSAPHKLTPGQKLVSKEYGYAALGGIVPGRYPSTSVQANPRLHPSRTFLPGQTYGAEDLNPYAEPLAQGQQQRKGRNRRPMPSAEDVIQTADYKNVAFLERFLSPSGKIMHSAATKLPPHLQKKVAKQIKLARNMAFIAGESLYEKRHLKFLREAEERKLRT